MSEAATSETHDGGCLCGAVRFRAVGAPDWVAHCHCASCRRATGAALATWVGYPDTAVTITSGALETYPSSPGVERGFCAACGTPISYRASRFPGEIHLTIGSLDDAGALDPTLHVWEAERLPWLDLADTLPRHPASSRPERG